ncbi:MAG: FkbM family methyltransferase [Panacagrimonas sp.]
MPSVAPQRPFWIRAIRRIATSGLNASRRVVRPLLGENAPAMPAMALRDPFLRDLRTALPQARLDVIFDVGANIGQSVRKYREAFPDALVHAFEPVAESYKRLSSSFATDARVRCERLAFSARRDGHAHVRAVGTSTVNHLILGAPRPGMPTEEVPLESGDAYCAEHGIERIDFLKIDTEGHDLQVVTGFADMLAQHRIDFLQVEASMNPLNERHVSLKKFVEMLEPMGYYLFGIYDQAREVRKGQIALRRSNPVFVSQRMPEWPAK